MNSEYRKAYSEVSFIINQLEKEEFDKIPKKLIRLIEKKKDKHYPVEISKEVSLENQNLLQETKAILAVIYNLYLSENPGKLQTF